MSRDLGPHLSPAGRDVEARSFRRQDRLMLISPERVFYAGLLGRPSERVLGGIAVYVAIEGPLRLSCGGRAGSWSDMAVAPAYAPHRIETEGRNVICLLVEPETVAPDTWHGLAASGDEPAAAAAFVRRVRSAYEAVRRSEAGGLDADAFDATFFGAPLPRRRLDPRVGGIAAYFQATADVNVSGSACAASVGLSLSRFLHLFKDETGAPFRAFRAWRRARNVLHHVDQDANLAHLALDVGYPDSTHFSHSVRRIFGLQPSAMFAGSRAMRIVRSRPAAPLPGRRPALPVG